ncbi:MAG: hypothetical protein VX976_01540 [Pseudomonadota bacterium]|nr:hypothetical protein [Pseudomonadota bacterium]
MKANTFSEVFGSEGAAGIENPKTRSLSYSFQYLTLTGSIGYVVKKLHNSGFLEPFGLSPNSFESLSPLAYKNNYILDKHTANKIAVSQNLDELNFVNDYKKNLLKSRYSARSIELRNNANFEKSLANLDNRKSILERYYNE